MINQYARGKQKLRDHVRALVDGDGELVTERKAIADVLNTQFKSVYVVEEADGPDILPIVTRRTDASFDIEYASEGIDVCAVAEIPAELGSDKASDVDDPICSNIAPANLLDHYVSCFVSPFAMVNYRVSGKLLT